MAKRLLAGELTPEDREAWVARLVSLRDNPHQQPTARACAAKLLEREARRADAERRERERKARAAEDEAEFERLMAAEDERGTARAPDGGLK